MVPPQPADKDAAPRLELHAELRRLALQNEAALEGESTDSNLGTSDVENLHDVENVFDPKPSESVSIIHLFYSFFPFRVTGT